MRELPIVWKRLVKDGQTCERCGSTLRQLESAVGKLEAALRPLDIRPTLVAEAIDVDRFLTQPAESNRVWIAGRPLEDWIGAEVGMSPCCSVCGESDCRTLEADGRTYETIPEALILKAGLAAAAELLASDSAAQTESCCSGGSCCR